MEADGPNHLGGRRQYVATEKDLREWMRREMQPCGGFDARSWHAIEDRIREAECEVFAAGRMARGVHHPGFSPSECAVMEMWHERFAVTVRRLALGHMDNGWLLQIPAALWGLYLRAETVDWNKPIRLNKRYLWALDPDAAHCARCLDLAYNSRHRNGFTLSELEAVGWPGDGLTDCGFECRCDIFPR